MASGCLDSAAAAGGSGAAAATSTSILQHDNHHDQSKNPDYRWDQKKRTSLSLSPKRKNNRNRRRQTIMGPRPSFDISASNDGDDSNHHGDDHHHQQQPKCRSSLQIGPSMKRRSTMVGGVVFQEACPDYQWEKHYKAKVKRTSSSSSSRRKRLGAGGGKYQGGGGPPRRSVSNVTEYDISPFLEKSIHDNKQKAKKQGETDICRNSFLLLVGDDKSDFDLPDPSDRSHDDDLRSVSSCGGKHTKGKRRHTTLCRSSSNRSSLMEGDDMEDRLNSIMSLRHKLEAMKEEDERRDQEQQQQQQAGEMSSENQKHKHHHHKKNKKKKDKQQQQPHTAGLVSEEEGGVMDMDMELTAMDLPEIEEDMMVIPDLDFDTNFSFPDVVIEPLARFEEEDEDDDDDSKKAKKKNATKDAAAASEEEQGAEATTNGKKKKKKNKDKSAKHNNKSPKKKKKQKDSLGAAVSDDLLLPGGLGTMDLPDLNLDVIPDIEEPNFDYDLTVPDFALDPVAETTPIVEEEVGESSSSSSSGEEEEEGSASRKKKKSNRKISSSKKGKKKKTKGSSAGYSSEDESSSSSEDEAEQEKLLKSKKTTLKKKKQKKSTFKIPTTGIELMKRLLRTKDDNAGSKALLKHCLDPHNAKHTIAPEDLLDAIAEYIDAIRTVNESNSSPEVVSARKIAALARLVILDLYGKGSAELASFERGLAPSFAPKYEVRKSNNKANKSKKKKKKERDDDDSDSDDEDDDDDEEEESDEATTAPDKPSEEEKQEAHKSLSKYHEEEDEEESEESEESDSESEEESSSEEEEESEDGEDEEGQRFNWETKRDSKTTSRKEKKRQTKSLRTHQSLQEGSIDNTPEQIGTENNAAGLMGCLAGLVEDQKILSDVEHNKDASAPILLDVNSACNPKDNGTSSAASEEVDEKEKIPPPKPAATTKKKSFLFDSDSDDDSDDDDSDDDDDDSSSPKQNASAPPKQNSPPSSAGEREASPTTQGTSASDQTSPASVEEKEPAPPTEDDFASDQTKPSHVEEKKEDSTPTQQNSPPSDPNRPSSLEEKPASPAQEESPAQTQENPSPSDIQVNYYAKKTSNNDKRPSFAGFKLRSTRDLVNQKTTETKADDKKLAKLKSTGQAPTIMAGGDVVNQKKMEPTGGEIKKAKLKSTGQAATVLAGGNVINTNKIQTTPEQETAKLKSTGLADTILAGGDLVNESTEEPAVALKEGEVLLGLKCTGRLYEWWELNPETDHDAEVFVEGVLKEERVGFLTNKKTAGGQKKNSKHKSTGRASTTKAGGDAFSRKAMERGVGEKKVAKLRSVGQAATIVPGRDVVSEYGDRSRDWWQGNPDVVQNAEASVDEVLKEDGSSSMTGESPGTPPPQVRFSMEKKVIKIPKPAPEDKPQLYWTQKEPNSFHREGEKEFVERERSKREKQPVQRSVPGHALSA